MISANQSLAVLVAAAVLSLVFAAIYKLQEFFKADGSQRLYFLKAHIGLIWAASLASVVVLAANAGSAIGNLISVPQMNRAAELGAAKLLANDPAGISLSQIILSAYALGVLFMLMRLFASYRQLRRIERNAVVQQVSGHSVWISDFKGSPFSFGIYQPRIFVPSCLLANTSADELRIILAHEATHIQNRDPQWKIYSLLTHAFLFFSPVSSYLHRKLDLEMEIECDRRTMQITHTKPAAYGHLLIDSVVALQNQKLNPMFTYMSETNLKRRIQAMKAQTLRRPFLSMIFGGLVLAAGFTAVAATTGAASYGGQYYIKTEVLINGQPVAKPTFTVLPNEEAIVEMKSKSPAVSLDMTLTATEYSSREIRDGIDLRMKIDYKNDTQQFKSNPRIVVKPGEEALVQIGSNLNSSMEMKITAVRK